jgi:hypothetical protein
MSGRKWQFYSVPRATLLSDLQLAYQVVRRFPGGKRNHRSRCWVLGEGQRQASISEDVCASKQLRSFTNGTTDGLFRSSHKQSRRLHARRACNLRRLQSQRSSKPRRLHEGSEDWRLFARSTFTNVVRFRRDIAALRHDCESGQSWPMPDNHGRRSETRRELSRSIETRNTIPDGVAPG